MTTTHTANNSTLTGSFGRWKGRQVFVRDGGMGMLPCVEHSLRVVHHVDAEGRHFCPTGFLMCDDCGGMAQEPEPYECNRWEPQE